MNEKKVGLHDLPEVQVAQDHLRNLGGQDSQWILGPVSPTRPEHIIVQAA